MKTCTQLVLNGEILQILKTLFLVGQGSEDEDFQEIWVCGFFFFWRGLRRVLVGEWTKWYEILISKGNELVVI